ncbi:MAG: hypothetical protein GY769_19430 [bacterium]|nr:hypothetical protein [bacterium]
MTSPPPFSRAHNLAPHVVAWSLLVVTTALLFVSSFESWGEPIIDLGRDLYIPSQILEGRVLYRDLLYNYGPAAPYLLAAITALFGDALWVFAACGALTGVTAMVGLYGVGCALGGRGFRGAAVGFASAFLFLTLSFFTNSTGGANFVLPYSFAATFAAACSMGSFLLLLRHLYGARSPVSLSGSVLLLFAAVLSKQEIGLAIAAVHLLAWWAHRMPRKAILGTLASAALVAVLFLAAFAPREPHGDLEALPEHGLFSENLTKFAGDSQSADFFKSVSGFDRPLENLVRTLVPVGKIALVLILAGVGVVATRFFERRYLGVVSAIALVALSAFLIWLWAEVRLFQATPVVAIVAMVGSLARDRRDPVLLLAAFAFLSGLRVLLQFHPMWYGFYLLVPSYAFVVYALGVRLPAALPHRFLDRRATVAALAALALVLVGRFEMAMSRSHAEKTSTLITAKGMIRDYPTGRTESLNEFLDYAATRLAPENPTMVVLPEGVSLNYFTGFKNPTAYYLLTPVEIGSIEVERRMIRELDATKPDYLVTTSRDLSEYGRRGIGLDYAMELGDWIRASYDLERVFEADESEAWRVLLLKRRSGAASLPDSVPPGSRAGCCPG